MSLFYSLHVGQQATHQRRPPRKILDQYVLVVGMGTVAGGAKTV
jgi:hypothetical protein